MKNISVYVDISKNIIEGYQQIAIYSPWEVISYE